MYRCLPRNLQAIILFKKVITQFPSCSHNSLLSSFLRMALDRELPCLKASFYLYSSWQQFRGSRASLKFQYLFKHSFLASPAHWLLKIWKSTQQNQLSVSKNLAVFKSTLFKKNLHTVHHSKNTNSYITNNLRAAPEFLECWENEAAECVENPEATHSWGQGHNVNSKHPPTEQTSKATKSAFPFIPSSMHYGLSKGMSALKLLFPCKWIMLTIL